MRINIFIMGLLALEQHNSGGSRLARRDVGFGDPPLPIPMARRQRDGGDKGSAALLCEEGNL